MSQVISSIFLIIISVGLYFGFTDPTYQDTKALNQQKRDYDIAVDNAIKLDEQRDQLSERLASFPLDDIDRLNKLIPDFIDHVRLIVEIDQIARKYGMAIRDIDIQGLPNEVISETNAKTKRPDTTTTLAVPRDYDSVTLFFSTIGTYDVFKRFMKDLEDNLRVADISSVQFSGTPQSTKVKDLYQYKISLKTYWLKVKTPGTQ